MIPQIVIAAGGIGLLAFLFGDAWFCSQDGRNDVAGEIMWILAALVGIGVVVGLDWTGGVLWR